MTGFWEKVKKLHLKPTEFYEDLDSEGFSTASRFAGTVGLIFGALISLFMVGGLMTGEVNLGSFIFIALMILFFLPLIFIISAFFQAGIVHVAVYLFGERGFEKTFNAIAYPVSAIALWGWIPILNFGAGVYSIYLQSKGLEILHDISLGKAFVAVIWPVILSIILVFGLIFTGFLAGMAA